MSDEPLLQRSIRTLAWLGDAEFEREVRIRVARRGDYPTDRLDAIKAHVVRAEAQAALLDAISHELTENEAQIARRARNAVPGTSRGRRNTREYRQATGFEALIAHWALGADGGWRRFESLVVPLLEAAIDEAVARRASKPRRG